MGGKKSSPPPYPQDAINRLADQYVRDQQADVGPYLKAISDFGDRLTAKVDDVIAKGGAKLDSEQATLLTRLDDFNQKLAAFQETQNVELLSDLGGINTEFQKAMDLLDEKDKAEFQTQLSSFEADASKLVGDFDARATSETERGFQEGKETLSDYETRRLESVAETERREFAETGKFKADSDKLTQDYRDETKSLADTFRDESLTEIYRREAEGKDVIGRFDSESKSLGDTFLSMVGKSTDDYQSVLDQARDLSPERLSQFTQAADFISKAALQTRMDMRATADPRALELSAIADENAAAMMSGRISADVQANLARSSAMQALQGGFGAGGEMGRGLSARDLGLTSLQLMQQGTKMYDDQRRLNYETLIRGVSEGAGANAGQMLANDQNLMRQGAADILTAQTDRNRTFFDIGQRSLTERQRSELDQLNKVSDARGNVFTGLFNAGRQDAQGVFDKRQANQNLILGSNLATIRYGAERTDNTLNTALAGNLANIDTRTGRNLNTANTVLQSGLDTNRLGFASEQNNLAQRTRRQADTATNMWDRDFQTQVGIYNANLGTGRTLYGTNVNAVGNIYNTNTGFIRESTGNQINTAGNVYQGDTRARTNAFDTMARVRGSAMGTKIDATQKGWEADRATWASNTENSNALWGNLAQMGATIGGAVIGTAAGGNTLTGMQSGSMVGSGANQAISGGGSGSGGGGSLFGSMSTFLGALGGRNTSGLDNQWGMYGKNPTGWNNFNYGSGTGA
jgi:hypothetical protein